MRVKLAVVGIVAVFLAFQQQVRAQQQNSDALLSQGSPFRAEATAGGLCCEGDHCGECCCNDPCCPPVWQVFGDFLYLRPCRAGISYAVPINGDIDSEPAIPVQVGPMAVADPTFEPGFRVGFGAAVSECSSLMGTFSWYESSTADQVSVSRPIVLRSLVVHPGTPNAAADFLEAQARYDLDFKTVDLDFRHIFACGDQYALTWLAGARYAQLEQSFGSEFTVLGTETVTSDVDFDGGGIRVGLEGEWHAANCGVMLYGKGTASFVGGRFRGKYYQGSSFDPTVVDTGWDGAWVVTMLDLELGIGWQSPGGTLRVTAGYMFSGWEDAVLARDFIRAVQTNNFNDDLGDSLVFDGLVTRAELRF